MDYPGVIWDGLDIVDLALWKASDLVPPFGVQRYVKKPLG